MPVNEYDIVICRMLYEWMQTKEREYTDAVFYVDKQYWWQGYDIFGTYEALEARIRLDTYCKIASEIREIIRLFGKEISNYTK